MVTVMDELTGKELLIADGEIAELDPKSCLVCSRFQMRDRGRTIVCTKRLKIEMPVEAWGSKDRGRAHTRATRCGHFVDMRGN